MDDNVRLRFWTMQFFNI